MFGFVLCEQSNVCYALHYHHKVKREVNKITFCINSLQYWNIGVRSAVVYAVCSFLCKQSCSSPLSFFHIISYMSCRLDGEAYVLKRQILFFKYSSCGSPTRKIALKKKRQHQNQRKKMFLLNVT